MPFSDPEMRRRYHREYARKPGVKEQRKKTYRKWADKNREHLAAAGAKRRFEKRAMVLVATARTRARKGGLEFDLDLHIEDIQRRIDAGLCELTGQPFDLTPGRKFNSPSLDRRDPSKGYTYENVRIVLNLVNAALGDWGDAVLREVMAKWLTGCDSQLSIESLM